MTDLASVTQLPLFPETLLPPKPSRKWPSLHTAWRHTQNLPAFVRDAPTVMRLLDLIGPLDWDRFPDRNCNDPQILDSAVDDRQCMSDQRMSHGTDSACLT